LTELGNGKVIRGVVVATSKYFYLINANGQVIVVNKAWVVSIMPVQSQNKNEHAGTLVGAIGGPYGEEKK
jgi:sRNA-binding regulator protein Hfq